jgi:hypothetical protein
MLPILAAIFAASGVVLMLVLAWWGLPFLAVAAVLLFMYIAASRKSAGPDAGTIERGRRAEPTGAPRKQSGGPGTANERVGQT